MTKDSSTYGMQPDSNSKVRQWLNVNHVDNDKLLSKEMREFSNETIVFSALKQIFWEKKIENIAWELNCICS